MTVMIAALEAETDEQVITLQSTQFAVEIYLTAQWLKNILILSFKIL